MPTNEKDNRYVTCEHVLHAVQKHVPSWNIFQISMVCRSEKCAFLKHVSDCHPENFVISWAENDISFES